MNANQLEALEVQIASAKQMIELANSLERLKSNQDFRKVVLGGYFEQEAIRLVHLKSDPNMQTAEKQTAIVQAIDAIGCLHQYFRTIDFLANQAQKTINDADSLREEILASED